MFVLVLYVYWCFVCGCLCDIVWFVVGVVLMCASMCGCFNTCDLFAFFFCVCGRVCDSCVVCLCLCVWFVECVCGSLVVCYVELYVVVRFCVVMGLCDLL